MVLSSKASGQTDPEPQQTTWRKQLEPVLCVEEVGSQVLMLIYQIHIYKKKTPKFVLLHCQEFSKKNGFKPAFTSPVKFCA